MIATQYIDQGAPVNIVLQAVGLSKSSYYYQNRYGKKGAKPSTHTRKSNGEVVTNLQVVNEIELLLQEEFVDYGYIKVTYWLRLKMLYVINLKKVYRLMKEHKLLCKVIQRNRSGKKWVKYAIVEPVKLFELLEFDIKYIYIHQERKNALLITVIDVATRVVLGWKLAWSMKKGDVKDLLAAIFASFRTPENITVRNDNGSQFEANMVREFLKDAGVVQEFTRPATPQQNGHIESYHSIVESAVCKRYEMESLDYARNVFQRFTAFYNHKRLHAGVKYSIPALYLQSLGLNIKEEFNPVYLSENMYICMPVETEAGSAGEQPARDKSGAYTENTPMIQRLACPASY